jgi:hypothetical protein
MADLNAALAANRAAVNDLLATAERSATTWTTPRAPGKWSPSQLVEHVAISLEESGNDVSGAPSKFRSFPKLVRPLLRRFLLNRVLARNAFPKARTSRAFNPATGPSSPKEARARLEAALGRFDQACRARAASGQPVQSNLFGAVPVEDYARFQELHTRHHCKQLPEGG